jgi:hypothetical protein
MLTCGAPGAQPPDAVLRDYTVASQALIAKNYRGARAGAQNVVDGCAAATREYAAQQAAKPQPSPTPVTLPTYAPMPLATLGPDPALAQGVR